MIELCSMMKCFLRFPYENCMFHERETYVSRSENECFPHGKRRKTKYKFLFVTMSFYIDEKAKHRDSEVPSMNKKGYWKPVAFISKFA